MTLLKRKYFFVFGVIRCVYVVCYYCSFLKRVDLYNTHHFEKRSVL